MQTKYYLISRGEGMNYSVLTDNLKGEYKKAFEQVELYGTLQGIGEEIMNDKMVNLYDMLLTAQQEERPVEKIIGKSTEVFCKDYFEDYDIKEWIQEVPYRIYRLAVVVFILEFMEVFLWGEQTDLLHATSDMVPWICGVAGALLLDIVANIILKPMMFKTKKIPPMAYYFLIILLFFVMLVFDVMVIMKRNSITMPALPMLIISGVYIAGFLGYRKIQTGSFKKKTNLETEYIKSLQQTASITDTSDFDQAFVKQLAKKYEKMNKKRIKQKKAILSQQEFAEQMKQEQKKWSMESLPYKCLWAAMTLTCAGFCWLGVAEAGVFLSIAASCVTIVVEVLIYLGFRKIERDGNKKRSKILQECFEQNITIIEYAKRIEDSK